MVKKSSDLKFYQAVGRRKTSTAQVRLYIATKEVTIDKNKLKKGEVLVNNKSVATYFPGESLHKLFQTPLVLTDALDRFAISIRVAGGGIHSQLGAVVHGLARALEKADATNRPLLKKEGLLTRDPRTKEKRKVGTGGKARHKKQSPKR